MQNPWHSYRTDRWVVITENDGRQNFEVFEALKLIPSQLAENQSLILSKDGDTCDDLTPKFPRWNNSGKSIGPLRRAEFRYWSKNQGGER
jgi:hypothetical protein|tara:strand:- start:1071 stop:1340 length:270 start_codon:yes stop_codon:yes gene_type:complete